VSNASNARPSAIATGLVGQIPDAYKKLFTADKGLLFSNSSKIVKTFAVYGIIDGLYEPKEKTFTPAELSAFLSALYDKK
jgi:hypothetical protein